MLGAPYPSATHGKTAAADDGLAAKLMVKAACNMNVGLSKATVK